MCIRDRPKSSLGKALEYAKELLPNMYFILEDGHLEIDNNAAERAIKPFVIGRKNWLFCKNQKGAHASATIYSICLLYTSKILVAGFHRASPSTTLDKSFSIVMLLMIYEL